MVIVDFYYVSVLFMVLVEGLELKFGGYYFDVIVGVGGYSERLLKLGIFFVLIMID